MRSVKKADQCELDRPQGQEEEHKHTLRRVVAKKQRQQRVQSTLQRVTTAIQLTQCGLSVYSPLLLHENHRCFPGPFTWHCCVPFAFSTASASAVAARSESTLCPIPTKKERHHTHITSHHTHTHAPTRARTHTQEVSHRMHKPRRSADRFSQFEAQRQHHASCAPIHHKRVFRSKNVIRQLTRTNSSSNTATMIFNKK